MWQTLGGGGPDRQSLLSEDRRTAPALFESYDRHPSALG